MTSCSVFWLCLGVFWQLKFGKLEQGFSKDIVLLTIKFVIEYVRTNFSHLTSSFCQILILKVE